MRESSTYQGILEEGRQEGAVLTLRRSVLALLENRFGTVPADVEARINAATDPDRLEAALLAVLRVNAPGELPL